MRLVLVLAGLFVTLGNAQDVPTRQATLQHLEEMLSRRGELKWIQAPMNPDPKAELTNVTANLTNVAVDGNACTVSFKDSRDFPNQNYKVSLTLRLGLAEIDRIAADSLEAYMERFRSELGQPPWATKTTPKVFVVQVFAAKDRKFAAHRWSLNSSNEVIEREQPQSPLLLPFLDESIARDFATALQKVKNLCTR
jgi:hypothetical protein